MELSIVSTLYRSAPHVAEFCRRMIAAAEQVTSDFELVLVNDGSPDQSLAVALEQQRAEQRIRIIDLSRNFGHHPAILAGLRCARGKLVFLIDCDLEEDPAWLPRFRAELQRSGADVVYGVQDARRGGWFERVTGWGFYTLFNALSSVPLSRNLVTARLMTRRYVDALTQYEEREIFMAGLWAATGFQQVPLTVEKLRRAPTSYGLLKRIQYVVIAITSFSNLPLVFVFYLGCLISGGALLAAAYLVVRRLFFKELLSGWPSLIVSIWLLGGITIFCLGIVGVYLARVYSETKRRPSVIIRAVYEARPIASADAPAESLEYAPERDREPRRRILHVEP